MSNKLQEMTQDMQARISEVAYMMWESAGRQQGMAMEFWLKAEQEVLSTLQAAANHMMTSPSKAEPRTPAATSAAPGAAPSPEPSAEAQAAAIEAPQPALAADAVPPAAPRKTAARGRSKTLS